ncbi:sigma-70 family RNA polymerase sigma factor [Catenovulum sp. 2E275]|uniref:RNA polymerase sigma factor n=1 Tax=Catenovulum sp. 2E275 TaxID=2980497 RepID=UPI0021CEB566|nr:sigma-70 family RNA polymerase sigma factor [Catenovulum sp. 2E275]MCU4676949.1 sigma-70 family RNA polymerase sigma factor [Catenovulum sp. 2E275]
MTESFNRLIQQNQGRIRYIAMRYCRSDDKDDLVQEILMQLWRSFNTFKGDAQVSTWLYRVALNTALGYARKHNKMPAQTELNKSHEKAVTEHTTQADLLQAYLNALNDTDAALLILYLDDIAVNEIADILGISANATSARISRIKQFLESTFVGGDV